MHVVLVPQAREPNARGTEFGGRVQRLLCVAVGVVEVGAAGDVVDLLQLRPGRGGCVHLPDPGYQLVVVPACVHVAAGDQLVDLADGVDGRPEGLPAARGVCTPCSTTASTSPSRPLADLNPDERRDPEVGDLQPLAEQLQRVEAEAVDDAPLVVARMAPMNRWA